MTLACLDSPAPVTLRRLIIEKKKTFPSLELLAICLLKLLSKPVHSAVSFANIFPTGYFQIYAYAHYKGPCRDFLRPKKVTDKVGAPKSVNAATAALCP